MNREIKFRAWIRCGEWDEESDKQKFVMIDGDSLAFEEYLPLCDLLKNKEDEVYFMQFTGLKDKNGVEIYEGDWCEAKFRTMDGIQVIQGQIIMDEFMWSLDCTGCVGDDIFSINRPHDFLVIGNIYENPNLIS